MKMHGAGICGMLIFFCSTRDFLFFYFPLLMIAYQPDKFVKSCITRRYSLSRSSVFAVCCRAPGFRSLDMPGSRVADP